MLPFPSLRYVENQKSKTNHENKKPYLPHMAQCQRTWVWKKKLVLSENGSSAVSRSVRPTLGFALRLWTEAVSENKYYLSPAWGAVERWGWGARAGFS